MGMWLYLVLCICILSATSQSVTSEICLRGINPNDLMRFSQHEFVCNDNYTKIPSIQINDNYCDCPDGSDEPGTSACAHLSSVGSTDFWCRNAAYKGMWLRASRVDDGLCDCCDGSDEPEGRCPDACAELRAKELSKVIELTEQMRRAMPKRNELELQAKATISASKGRLTDLEAKLAQLRKHVEAAREVKAQEEEREARERESLLQSSGKSSDMPKVENEAKDGAVQVASTVPPTSSSSPVDLTASGDTELQTNAQQENSLDVASEHGATEETPDTSADSASAFPYPAEYAYNPEATASDSDEPLAMESDDEEMRDPKQLDDPETLLEDTDDSNADDELPDSNAPPVPLPSAGTSQPSLQETGGIYRSPAAEAAREETLKLEKQLKESEDVIAKLQKELALTSTLPPVLYALKDECAKIVHGSYTYEMCFFGQAAQIEGGRRTSLGTYTQFIRPSAKKSEPAAASASPDSTVGSLALPPPSPTSIAGVELMFENGHGCWQGPNRSLRVTLKCGEGGPGGKPRAVFVDEPSKCVYHMVVETPAACDEADLSALSSILEPK